MSLIVMILVVVAVARLDPVYNREGPDELFIAEDGTLNPAFDPAMVQESARKKVKKEVDDVSVLESVENSDLPAVKDETDLERVPSECSIPTLLRDSPASEWGLSSWN
ncbi:hypothetical protein F5146DRAFT_1001431 [Armillaria mellea]|nr:hypothetical protein F5146DRAFT_1001431 [Armillaria mellea]